MLLLLTLCCCCWRRRCCCCCSCCWPKHAPRSSVPHPPVPRRRVSSMPPPRPRRRVSSKRQVSFPVATEDQSVLVVETDSDGCPEKVTRGKFARRASEMFRAGMPCKRRQTDLNCAGTQQLRSSLPSAARAAQGAENSQGWNGLLQFRRQHVQDEAHAASNSSSGNGYRFLPSPGGVQPTVQHARWARSRVHMEETEDRPYIICECGHWEWQDEAEDYCLCCHRYWI